MNDKASVTLGEFMQSADKWVTVTTLAKRMMVHPDTIRRWATSGRIKSIRHPINNYRLFRLEDLGSEKLKLDEE